MGSNPCPSINKCIKVNCYSVSKEGNSDIRYNIDESWGYYNKWTKSVTKRQKTDSTDAR